MVTELKVKVVVIVAARHLVQKRLHERVTQHTDARRVTHQGVVWGTTQGHHVVGFVLEREVRKGLYLFMYNE